MKEGIGARDKYDAGIEISDKLNAAWQHIFRYENFYCDDIGNSTNIRSELNDRADKVRCWSNSTWPNWVGTISSYAASGAYYNTSPSVSPAASISYTYTSSTPVITPYADMFNEPPWYEKVYTDFIRLVSKVIGWVCNG